MWRWSNPNKAESSTIDIFTKITKFGVQGTTHLRPVLHSCTMIVSTRARGHVYARADHKLAQSLCSAPNAISFSAPQTLCTLCYKMSESTFCPHCSCAISPIPHTGGYIVMKIPINGSRDRKWNVILKIKVITIWVLLTWTVLVRKNIRMSHLQSLKVTMLHGWRWWWYIRYDLYKFKFLCCIASFPGF